LFDLLAGALSQVPVTSMGWLKVPLSDLYHITFRPTPAYQFPWYARSSAAQIDPLRYQLGENEQCPLTKRSDEHPQFESLGGGERVNGVSVYPSFVPVTAGFADTEEEYRMPTLREMATIIAAAAVAYPMPERFFI
jgi:hypothetical protein